MSYSATTKPVLLHTFWPAKTKTENLIRGIILALVGTGILTISAKVQVPLYPVPITLQTLVVLSIGATFGPWLGGATMLLYLLEGLIGLPVFAGTPERGTGLAYLLQGTGGYIIGYIPAAMLVGWLAQHRWDRSIGKTALAMLLGNIVIYIPGLIWLGFAIGWDKPVIQQGLTPFLVGDVLKLAIAVCLFPSLWKLVHHLRGQLPEKTNFDSDNGITH